MPQTPVSPVDPPLVDAHAHIYTLDLPKSATAWHHPAADASVEQYLATLDAHGVGYAVIAAVSIFEDDNQYAIGACRRHPRLRTTVIIPPDTDLQTLERMKADGVVGVRFQWRHLPEVPDLSTPEYQRFMRRLADVGWHVHLHDEGRRLARPIEQIEASGVNLVVDHFGRPDAQLGLACPGFQRLLRSVETGRTWVKLSAGFRMASQEAAVATAAALLEHAGPERLVWGSDWPFAAHESSMSYAKAIEGLAAWVPDPVARRRIGSETPWALYFS